MISLFLSGVRGKYNSMTAKKYRIHNCNQLIDPSRSNIIKSSVYKVLYEKIQFETQYANFYETDNESVVSRHT